MAAIGGAGGVIVTMALFSLFLWSPFEPSGVVLLLSGPLVGGALAGYLDRGDYTGGMLAGTGSGLLAAFPVIAIVLVNIVASNYVLDSADLSDS